MDFGLYIHVPFCRTVCPYCEFNVVGWRDPPWDVYLEGLTQELNAHYTQFSGRRLRTLYFGGGTPSLMPLSIVEKVVKNVKDLCGDDGLREMSFELNPGTVDLTYLEGLRSLGINRVSIGWQATQQRLLTILGRDHDAQESRTITEWALELGFPSVSLDVIFAVPGQTEEELDTTLSEVIDVGTQHVSMYEMTFDEGTPFARKRDKGQLIEQEDTVVVRMMERIAFRLQAAGYERYEVSSFARGNHRSLHNHGYWTGLPYLGIGPGAHGLRHLGPQGWERYQSIVSIRSWLEYWGAPQDDLKTEWVEPLNEDTRFEEQVLTLVRLGDPFSVQPEFLLGHRRDDWSAGLDEAIRRGWISKASTNMVRTTNVGMRFADSLGLLLIGG